MRYGVPLHDLPCGGCKYCKTVQSQWKKFEEDVEFVIPLTIRSVNVSNPVTSRNVLEVYDLK